MCYREYEYQAAAYQKLFKDSKLLKINQAIILSLDKEDGRFRPYPFYDLNKELQIFLHLLEIYWLQKKS